MNSKKITVIAIVAMLLMTTTSIFAQEKKKGNPEKVFKRLDTNEDGFITVNELEANEKTKKLAKRFLKIDANEDAKVSLEEFIAFRAKAGKKKKQ